MKNRLCLLLLFCLFLFHGSPAKELPKYCTSINPFEPKVGEQTERTILVSVSCLTTNGATGSITNEETVATLKALETALAWDSTNDYARMDIIVEKCTLSDHHTTEAIIKPGIHLLGKYILGEWSFRPAGQSTNESISFRAGKMLSAGLPHPELERSSFDHMRFDQPRSVGETWNLDYQQNLLHLTDVIFGSSDRRMMQYFLKNLDTNHITAVMQLGGITNTAGIRCFFLASKGTMSFAGKPVSGRMTAECRYLFPVEPSQTFWQRNASLVSYINMRNSNNTNAVMSKTTQSILAICHSVSKNRSIQ